MMHHWNVEAVNWQQRLHCWEEMTVFQARLRSLDGRATGVSGTRLNGAVVGLADMVIAASDSLVKYSRTFVV